MSGKADPKLFHGISALEYRGLPDSGSGWRRSMKNHINAKGKKLDPEARGPFVMTFIADDSEAARTLAHLSEEEINKEGGDKLIFDALDSRYPTTSVVVSWV